MNTPIESAEDLAKQTQIQYGVYEYGTTADFFRVNLNLTVVVYFLSCYAIGGALTLDFEIKHFS